MFLVIKYVSSCDLKQEDTGRVETAAATFQTRSAAEAAMFKGGDFRQATSLPAGALAGTSLPSGRASSYLYEVDARTAYEATRRYIS